jgi:hypothetical protein
MYKLQLKAKPQLLMYISFHNSTLILQLKFSNVKMLGASSSKKLKCKWTKTVRSTTAKQLEH